MLNAPNFGNMVQKGFISINRQIQDHWVWQDATYLKWWITILMNVNYAPTKFPVNNELHVCKRGESFRSIEGWTSLFGCSKKTTLKFFKLLEKDEMIERNILGSGNRRKHLLIVVNYDKYQRIETEDTPEGNQNLHLKVPSNNKKNKRIKHTPPSINDFETYFLTNGYPSELAQRAFKGYDEAGWVDSKGNKIRNWKQKCHHVWFRPENKMKFNEERLKEIQAI